MFRFRSQIRARLLLLLYTIGSLAVLVKLYLFLQSGSTAFRSAAWVPRAARPFPAEIGRAGPLARRRVFILTHELSATGAPRVCAELAALLRGYGGADVILSVQGWTAPLPLALRWLSQIVPSVNFSVDLVASVDAARAADVVIVSTVAPHQIEWMHRFRVAAPRHGGLIWWVHEGQSVMHQWDAAYTDTVADAMTSGLVNALIFPSASTRVWWTGVVAARAAAAFANTGARVPALPTSLSLPWGLPAWRTDAPRASIPARGAALRARLYIAPDAFVFLVVASYNPLKGHRGIAKAFKRAQAACGTAVALHLVTVGVALGALPHYFPQKDLEWARADPVIHLLNATDAVSDFLAAADAVISNTLDGGETWGLANLEALAAGVPLLSSRAGGASEMLRDGVTALLHDVPLVADDSEEVALAANMCRVVTDVGLRTALRERGRAHAVEHLGQAYLETDVVGALAELIAALQA